VKHWNEAAMLEPQSALIYTMVLVSAADGNMSDSEIAQIGDIVRMMPAFRDYDMSGITEQAADCAEALSEEDGLEKILDQIVSALPARLAETAYAVACDVAAADGAVAQEEARLLEILRYRLDIDRLAAAAIERGAKARYQII
jgi:tellurite resistance protein